MDRCCWNCAKGKIDESSQVKLAKAFQAHLKPGAVVFHKASDYRLACPVTGGLWTPASEEMLKRVWTGCMTLTCFEPKGTTE